MIGHIIMLVGAKVYDLTEDLLWFVCGLYVGILTSSRTLDLLCHVCVTYLCQCCIPNLRNREKRNTKEAF